jgi:hypothetical protein
MPIEDAIVQAVLKVAAAGAVGGLVGGLLASVRASLIGSILMGAIGGIVAAAILRIVNVTPLVDAGQGFSYVYGLAGGVVLAYSVSASNKA